MFVCGAHRLASDDGERLLFAAAIVVRVIDAQLSSLDGVQRLILTGRARQAPTYPPVERCQLFGGEADRWSRRVADCERQCACTSANHVADGLDRSM